MRTQKMTRTTFMQLSRGDKAWEWGHSDEQPAEVVHVSCTETKVKVFVEKNGRDQVWYGDLDTPCWKQEVNSQ